MVMMRPSFNRLFSAAPSLLPGGLLPPLRVVEEQVLAAAAASVTFSSIDTKVPTGSLHLVVLVYAASDQAVTQGTNLRFNGDAGANYNRQRLSGINITASAARSDGQTSTLGILAIPGTDYASAFGGGSILIPHFANTAKHKNVLGLGGGAEDEVDAILARWASTSAITSVAVIPGAGNFAANSRFVLCVVDERYNLASSILGGAGTFSFTSISQNYGDLVVIGDLRTDRVSAGDGGVVQINGDTTATNYFRQSLQGLNAAAESDSANSNGMSVCVADSATASTFGPVLAAFFAYALGDNQKAYLTQSGRHDSVGPGGDSRVVSGRRANIAAITSLAFVPEVGTNFMTNSGMWLYGSSRGNTIARRVLGGSQSAIEFGYLIIC